MNVWSLVSRALRQAISFQVAVLEWESADIADLEAMRAASTGDVLKWGKS